MVRVNASSLTLRDGAGDEYASLGTYYSGCQVVIEWVDGHWGRVGDGWIDLNYVTKLR